MLILQSTINIVLDVKDLPDMKGDGVHERDALPRGTRGGERIRG